MPYSTPPSEKNNVSLIASSLSSIRDSHVYFFIVLVTCVIYGKSVLYQYTYSDDTQLLVVNQEFLSNLANIPKLFTADVFISIANAQVFYRPFLNFLFMLELQISKGSPVIFHVTNILLHLGCSLLLFAVFKQLKLSRSLAAVAALFFCALPINAAAVVWIPGRNDSLLTILVLGSFSMFLRALDSKRVWPWVGHFILFFLALLTKESAIALPLLSAGYFLFVRNGKLERKTSISVAVGYALLVILWVVLRSLVTRPFEVHQSLMSMAGDWIKNSPGFVLYLGKVLLPFNLSVYPNLADHSLLLGWISILVFAIALLIRKPSSYREIVWGLAWFFLFLAPTFLSGTIFHEHRAYCSLVGLLFVVCQLPIIQAIDFSKNSRLLGVVVLLSIYAVIAMVHSEEFHDRTAYATGAYINDPSVEYSYVAVAGLFLDEGKYTEAERVLQSAIARDSSMKAIHRMLGDIYSDRREFGRAAREYETAIRTDPLQLYNYINYGKMCLASGKPDDAARLWKQSVMINPDFLLGYYYLANFYIHVRNDPDSAMMYARLIEQRGVTVMPELMRAIQENPLYGKRKQ